MPRRFAVAVLLAVLSLLTPGKVVAGPPEGVSGKMELVSDKVADTLRAYRAAKNDGKRWELLGKIASIKDPRIAVALGEALSDPKDNVRVLAAYTILYNQREGSMSGVMPKVFV
jgi:hypothetical protein